MVVTRLCHKKLGEIKIDQPKRVNNSGKDGQSCRRLKRNANEVFENPNIIIFNFPGEPSPE